MRDITNDAVTASEAQTGYSFTLAAEFDFETGPLRVVAGAAPVTFPDGRQFTAVGQLGTLENLEETVTGKAPRVKAELTGLESDPSLNLSTVLNEDLRNRTATVWAVWLNAASVVVEDPVVVFRGRMDNVLTRYGSTLSIGLMIATVLDEWQRARELRGTENLQANRGYPNDKLLEHVPRMKDLELDWGLPR